MTEFFLPMIPPRATAQEHKVGLVRGSPGFYDPPKLKDARAKLTAHLSQHVPKEKYTGAVRLTVKWCFPRGRRRDGEYKTTRPDTDNLQKLLKDCMTRCRFWNDDAQVVRETVEKRWADEPSGIYIEIEVLEGSA